MLIHKIAISISKHLLKITTFTSEELTGKATKKYWKLSKTMQVCLTLILNSVNALNINTTQLR